MISGRTNSLPGNAPRKRNLIPTLKDSVVRNRTLFSLLIFVYSFFDPNIKSKQWLWLMIAIYAVAQVVVRVLFSSVLYLKRVRIIPSLIDVLCVSLVIKNSSGPDNSWFLFYLFPIIEVSRYLSPWGTRILTAIAISLYTAGYLESATEDRANPRFFVMRCLVVIAVSEVSSRIRQRELKRLTDVHANIDKVIVDQIASGPFDKPKLEQVLNLILMNGIELTSSEIGYIKLLDDKTRRYEIATEHPRAYDWAKTPNDENNIARVAKSKQLLCVPLIRKPSFTQSLRTYFWPHHDQPHSALFVPLKKHDLVVGIIAVYSKASRHYTKMEERRLGALTPLAELAINRLEAAEVFNRVAEAELYYRELIQNAPDPIIVLDREGKIVVFNQACEKLWGYTFEQVKDQPVENYYATPDHARQIGRLMWLTDGNCIENFHARIKIKGGEIIPISLSACFVKKHGLKVCSIGVFKDRREAIRMEERMVQAEREAIVGRVAGTAGHSIKTKIAAAQNYLNTLLWKREPESQARLQVIYTKILSALSESIDELNALLATHKPKKSQKKLLPIAQILRADEERMRHQALDKNIHFVVNYPTTDFKVDVDLEQMLSVFANLFTNSVYAIQKRMQFDDQMNEGLITLSAQLEKQVHIIWQDNGCGISDDQISNIFNAFVTSKGDKGTGLGLYIVQTIVLNHDGRIEVKSPPGKGATFVITLPFRQ